MIPGIVAGQAGGSSGPTDPYFLMVASLLHFDGADGSTDFIDRRPNVWTPAGSAQIDTAIKKIGNASGLFPGPGSYISTPAFPGTAFGPNDLCFECWVYPTNASAGTNIGGNLYQSIIGQQVIGAVGNSSFVMALENLKPSAGLFQGGNFTSGITAASALPINTWSHVAYTRSGGTTRLFVDGVQVGSSSISGSVDTSSRTLVIGADSSFASVFEGQIDELRVTNGNSRYTANFTPDTTPFPNA